MASTATEKQAGLGQLIRDYATFLRLEPQARAYLAGGLIDDIGIAVSGWAMTLMMTNLNVTQAARATLMIPSLFCFLLGTLVSGPLADWFARKGALEIARWRWKVVLGGRAIETALLAIGVVVVASAPPTIARILPYFMVAAFMKTGLRATRMAFSVDILQEEVVRRGPNGEELLDEQGAPLRMKSYLVQFLSISSLVSTVAVLIGLVVGGQVMKLVDNRTWILFALDVLTNIGFLVIVYMWCRPMKARSPAPEVQTDKPIGRFRFFWRSLADGFRFLARPEQRPLVALLAGAWLVEVITEAYDGKMVIKHILSGGDDNVRYAEIVWTLVGVVGALFLPLIAQRVAVIGRIFVVTMFLDGAMIALAGHVAGAKMPSAILPFTAVIAIDQSLTLISGTLTNLAQNSVSSAAMRGRIAGSYAIVVILGDMLSEGLASVAETLYGIPGLVLRAGLLQIGLVGMIVLFGGRALWNFGLQAECASESAEPEVAS